MISQVQVNKDQQTKQPALKFTTLLGQPLVTPTTSKPYGLGRCLHNVTIADARGSLP
ncbi:hypothetical protein TTRE_0000365801 [Trichuris trichiura]|uniref:Uncharacterized protein n=1 Tax=Trichuris trichiura TaxID=36087 RepID=A0A077Z5G6_TRITR|nr:hypothetical protein TTRE_0000365801 [Trichuris trichiura]